MNCARLLAIVSRRGALTVMLVLLIGGAWPRVASGATPLNVITWNIRIDDSSESHARTAMDLLLATTPQPEVIVIEEAYQQWFSTYIDELQQRTGRTWQGVFATHCAPNNWTGSACSTPWYQGIGIFTTHAITSSNSTLFPFADCWTSARVGLRAAIDVGGTTVQVFAMHLQTGSCTDVRQARFNSMSQLKAWAANYSGPQIVAGDFNADMDQIDTTQGMLPNFLDSWPIVGSGNGFTALIPGPTMKLDYWFSDSGGGAVPTSTAVVTATGSVSDHYPVQATFVVQSVGPPSAPKGLRITPTP